MQSYSRASKVCCACYSLEFLIIAPCDYAVEQMLLPDSANSRSVQAFLKIVNLGFDVVQRSNAEQMSPSGECRMSPKTCATNDHNFLIKGQIPFVKCGAHVVAEMDAIVAMVNNKVTCGLEAGT